MVAFGLGHPQDACVVCYRRPGVSRERSWLAGVLLVLRNAEIKIYKAAYRHSYLRLYNIFFTPHRAHIAYELRFTAFDLSCVSCYARRLRDTRSRT